MGLGRALALEHGVLYLPVLEARIPPQNFSSGEDGSRERVTKFRFSASESRTSCRSRCVESVLSVGSCAHRGLTNPAKLVVATDSTAQGPSQRADLGFASGSDWSGGGPAGGRGAAALKCSGLIPSFSVVCVLCSATVARSACFQSPLGFLLQNRFLFRGGEGTRSPIACLSLVLLFVVGGRSRRFNGSN